MKRALLAKNKMKLVDGSISVPTKDNPMYSVWERRNNLVMSWIQKLVSPPISKSIEWIDAALEAWIDLESRFALGDAYRVSLFLSEPFPLFCCRLFYPRLFSVVEYFTHLKEMWDELINLRPIPGCNCDPQCTYGGYEKIRNYRDNDAAIKFLKGLNENFATLKSKILIMDPLPNLNRSANSNVHNAGFTPNAGNFQKKGNYKKFSNNSMMKCTHCGYSGHTVDICYIKHGFPPNYKSKGRSQNSSHINQVECAKAETNHQLERALFTTHVNTISTTVNSIGNESGIISLSFFEKSYSQKEKWIIDSGAKNHIICSLSYFKHYKVVSNCFVHLPNNQTTQVPHVGTMHLSNTFILQKDIQTIMRTIGSARKLHGLYILDKPHFPIIKLAAATTAQQLFPALIEPSQLWHYRLGHLSDSRMDVFNSIDSRITKPKLHHCEVCHFAKQKKIPFHISTLTVKSNFDLIHMGI
ncbi:uncharacterized protein LOC126669204 [Mercurialis annua]|uniref:uncharacterized protein LOC126669204 n=1 Tax=Mercurialis annua TaxID=3986 RepID=UPI00215EDC1F|nr:uncharacterized protein LOC126669204 [Mercurialis annua]